jgi:hypothetical protein
VHLREDVGERVRVSAVAGRGLPPRELARGLDVAPERPELERDLARRALEAMALSGMSRNCADEGDCASARPPSALIARRPSVPSDPAPESTTPMARPFASAASARKNASMGR